MIPILESLVRKEMVSIRNDPMSPERGQYGFLQDLVKRVAYDMLSRKDRRLRHLAAADYLAGVHGDDDEDVIEVIAAHRFDAYEAAPESATDDEKRIAGRGADASRRTGGIPRGQQDGRTLIRACRLARRRAYAPGRTARAGGDDGGGGDSTRAGRGVLRRSRGAVHGPLVRAIRPPGFRRGTRKACGTTDG